MACPSAQKAESCKGKIGCIPAASWFGIQLKLTWGHQKKGESVKALAESIGTRQPADKCKPRQVQQIQPLGQVTLGVLGLPCWWRFDLAFVAATFLLCFVSPSWFAGSLGSLGFVVTLGEVFIKPLGWRACTAWQVFSVSFVLAFLRWVALCCQGLKGRLRLRRDFSPWPF